MLVHPEASSPCREGSRRSQVRDAPATGPRGLHPDLALQHRRAVRDPPRDAMPGQQALQGVNALRHRVGHGQLGDREFLEDQGLWFSVPGVPGVGASAGALRPQTAAASALKGSKEAAFGLRPSTAVGDKNSSGLVKAGSGKRTPVFV